MPITKTKKRTQPVDMTNRACCLQHVSLRTGRVQTTKLKYLSNCFHLQKVVFNTYNKCHFRPCSVFFIRKGASQTSAGSGEPLWGTEVQWCRTRPWRVPWTVKCVLLACSVLLSIGTMWHDMSVSLEKNDFGGHASFAACETMLFSGHCCCENALILLI